MSYEQSVTLHQQDGGLTVQAFADREGLPLKTVRRYIRLGRIVGARQDSRSKKWTIYPPAKLVDKSGDVVKPREAAAGFDVAGGAHSGRSSAAPLPERKIPFAARSGKSKAK